MELEIENLTKQYGNKMAIQNVSCTLKPGVVGLLGANGAGKSTLMRMICGVMKPTSGTVRLGKYDVTDMGYRNLLGYPPQDFGYYPDFTGMEFTLLLTFLLSKPIGAYQLGEAYAQSMGVNIKFFRVALILLSSILSATVTAFAGPISFVGIAVPFLMKRSFGTSRPLIIIPGTFLGGAVFCMMCDLIARMAFAPLELNISTVTSIFGAPVVIFMMLRKKRGN